jgi:pimeloyl-ACP methyl ester carboxylesterase
MSWSNITGVLLLHGAGGSPEADFPFMDALAGAFPIVAPDLGVEDPRTTADVDMLAGRALEACGAAGVDRFVACGYSMGSLVAASVADAAPERTAGVVLSAGLVTPLASMRGALRVWRHLLDAPPDILGRYLMSLIYTTELLDTMYEAVAEELALQIATAASSSARAHIELLLAADTTELLRRGRQPLLVVCGNHDVLVSPSHADVLMSIRPDAQRVDLEAGNALGTHAPIEWASAITDFVARL